MSQAQSIAIRAWWAARKAAGWSKPKQSIEERRRKEREAKAAKYKADPEAIKADRLSFYHENREAIREARRKKYAEQAEKHRAKDKARRAANPERFSELCRARYERNKDKINARNKTWRGKNTERLRANARRRDALKAKTSIGPVDYSAILASSGGLCGICGGGVDTSNPKAYHFDHIVPLSRGGGHVQGNIQLSHAKCNMRKHARVA